MKKNIFLILSLWVAMQAGAQLTVRDYGNVEIGTNPEYPYPSGFNVTHADTVTALKIFGGGAMATGARIAATSEMSAGRRPDFVRKTMQAPQRGAPLGHIIEKGESASKRNFPARPLKFLFEAHIVSPAMTKLRASPMLLHGLSHKQLLRSKERLRRSPLLGHTASPHRHHRHLAPASLSGSISPQGDYQTANPAMTGA